MASRRADEPARAATGVDLPVRNAARASVGPGHHRGGHHVELRQDALQGERDLLGMQRSVLRLHGVQACGLRQPAADGTRHGRAAVAGAARDQR
ncbi:MAG TPA: hypothetical protein PLB41_09420, partial [Rubrivivax sp.]|nr:hypothetical protein [Rubrivivax sp.]